MELWNELPGPAVFEALGHYGDTLKTKFLERLFTRCRNRNGWQATNIRHPSALQHQSPKQNKRERHLIEPDLLCGLVDYADDWSVPNPENASEWASVDFVDSKVKPATTLRVGSSDEPTHRWS